MQYYILEYKKYYFIKYYFIKNVSNIFFFMKELKYERKKTVYFTQLNIFIFLFMPAYFIYHH